jgi:hypothetical protein
MTAFSLAPNGARKPVESGDTERLDFLAAAGLAGSFQTQGAAALQRFSQTEFPASHFQMSIYA